MNRSDFQLAERYIAQAEQVNVQYDPLYERFMDTPAKARKTLLQLRSVNAGAPAQPSDRRSPIGSGPSTADRTPPTPDLAGQRGPQRQLELRRNPQRQPKATGAVRPEPNQFAQNAEHKPLLPSDGQRTNSRNSAFRGGLAASPYDTVPAGGPMVVSDSVADRGPATGEIEPRRLPPLHPGTDPRKAKALGLLATARASLDRGEARTAKMLAEQARSLGVPDDAFVAGEPRPELLLMEINSVLSRQGPMAPGPNSGVANAYYAGPRSPNGFPVRQGLYNPANDSSRTVTAQSLLPPPGTAGLGTSSVLVRSRPSAGVELYQQGLRALENQDRDAALKLFGEAWKFEAELDPATRQRLRDKLTLLRVATPRPSGLPSGNVLEEVDSEQRILADKLFRDISREQTAAEKTRDRDPRGSLDRLQRLRDRIEQETLDPPTRRQLLLLVDRGIRETERYIQQNLPDIELRERNERVVDTIDTERRESYERQNKLAELVEEFNDLIEEERYAEADMIARQAHELEPESEVVRTMFWKAKFFWRKQEQDEIGRQAEQGFYDTLTSVEEAKTPFDDREPLVFADARTWMDMSRPRLEWLKRQQTRLTPAEQEIQSSLKTKVEVRFEGMPLSEVMDALGRMAGVNVYLDPEGLSAEGVTTEETVTINLTEPISLKSALNLILQPLRLSYVIQNEVLRITSEQATDSNVHPRVYNVADLVIPIPNFIPGYNIGLPGAIHEAINTAWHAQPLGNMQSLPLTVASNGAQAGGMANASVLAQMGSNGMLPSVTSRSPNPMGFSPGSLGGATQADFDTLIDLITSTIAPQTWDTVGGPGSIEGFPTNLSLVISQTQDVHEEIADLLDQLRRLQDLQVTIEVRYITLNDRFFERIGVDFDFEVDDNTSQISGQNPIVPDDTGPSMAFGLDPTGQPTLDFDYTFDQASFGSAVPQFGGFDAATAANFGFAILSDIEVFFLLQAATGDDRTNVLQAPKVTLFNGQTGFVSDTSQRPFVTSVIPVVGDFAAAHQPVVVVLSEGTSLSVQAVVSPDRRFVRLTLIPFFSSIGDVDTFTFHGRTSSDSGTVAADPANQASSVTNNQQEFTEGTTVQLPTFNFTTVSTTVSVPDGGTVLLGGIKRLSEGRNERGVPMLSKLPYINRLFKNVGIGRDTQSLMMMVTPRIIIQEEEEFQQTGYDSSQ